MAQQIFAARPLAHVDIGSRVDGFVAHLLTFMPVNVVDVRPLTSHLDGLSFVHDDATMLKQFRDNSVESLSSLHAVEHFGLGRYGDPVDPWAYQAAMRSMSRVIKPGGKLYFSVPVGRERLEFNAHRIFSPRTVLETFSSLELTRFAAVLDDGSFSTTVTPESLERADYACGLFVFQKPTA